MNSPNCFDDILVSLKTGKWNLIHFFGIGVGTFMIPSLVLAGAFLSPTINYLCHPPQEQQNVQNIDKCSYTIEQSLIDGKIEDLTCSKWNFSQEEFGETLTSEFELVCDYDYLRPTFQTVYMFGNFLGAPINGILSDRFGRRTLLYFGYLIATFTVLISSFVQDFTTVIILRFLTGLAHPPLIQTGYILAMEVCEPKYRSIVGIFISLPWAIGTMWWGALGYFIKDWRWLQRISVAPALVFVVFFVYFIEESPRWLIVRGRHEDALKVLRRAEKMNRSTLPSDEEIVGKMNKIRKFSLVEMTKIEPTLLKEETCLSATKRFCSRVFVLYKTSELRRRIFLMYTVFFVSSTVYYGLSLNAANLKLNPFLYMIVNGIMEIPAYTITAPIIAKFGRVLPTAVSYFACGVTIMALTVIPSDIKWLLITFAMLGKYFISTAYQIIYLMSSEIFPTEIRLQALGALVFVSRIGSIIAPYITDSLGPIYPWLPSVLFGSLSLTAGMASVFIPETLNENLDETIANLEEDAKTGRNKRSHSLSRYLQEIPE